MACFHVVSYVISEWRSHSWHYFLVQNSSKCKPTKIHQINIKGIECDKNNNTLMFDPSVYLVRIFELSNIYPYTKQLVFSTNRLNTHLFLWYYIINILNHSCIIFYWTPPWKNIIFWMLEHHLLCTEMEIKSNLSYQATVMRSQPLLTHHCTGGKFNYMYPKPIIKQACLNMSYFFLAVLIFMWTSWYMSPKWYF